MSISSYPRTIKNGQIASNGDANSGTGLMLWDSAINKYVAATPSTFSGGAGGATAANQVLTNAKLDTLINIFKGIDSSLLNAGNAAIPMDSGVQIGVSYTLASVLNVEGAVGIIGGTDNTFIGNTGSSLNIKNII